MCVFLKDSILPWGYGCNHAVFLESCDHDANEYTIWTWGSLVIDIQKFLVLTSRFRLFRLLILEVDRMLRVIVCFLTKELAEIEMVCFVIPLFMYHPYTEILSDKEPPWHSQERSCWDIPQLNVASLQHLIAMCQLGTLERFVAWLMRLFGKCDSWESRVNMRKDEQFMEWNSPT